MLKIWLFGTLSMAHGPSDASVTPVSGRCGSLLAYLALGRGRFFSRSELLGVLWPEHSAATPSAGSFNTALWRLRRLVERKPLRTGDLISSDRRGGIGLIGSTDVWLDTEEFEHHIAPGLGKGIELLTGPDIDGLRMGIELYKSDILVDLSEEWALREREKHRRLYLNALWRLMQVAAVRGLYSEGIRHAQTILDMDTLREDVHRELMRLFVLNGQRVQALQQFEACRQLLKRELAIGPMRETMELYRSIADNAVTGSSTAMSTSFSSLPETIPPAAGGLLFEPPNLPQNNAHSLVASARQHLAQADAQLELSLRFTRH